MSERRKPQRTKTRIKLNADSLRNLTQTQTLTLTLSLIETLVLAVTLAVVPPFASGPGLDIQPCNRVQDVTETVQVGDCSRGGG